MGESQKNVLFPNRFLTGPPTMSTEMCPPQVSIPTVFLRLSTSNFQRFRLIIYRALRLTVCLFIDGSSLLSP